MLGPDSRHVEALVLSASRRHVSLALNRSLIVPATISVRGLQLVAGDLVKAYQEGEEWFASSLVDRVNLLVRSYRGEKKPIAANIDQLFVVGAVPPLLNTLSIDRMAVVAHSQGIPWSLIVNKVDLGTDACDEVITTYRNLGVRVYQTAAKFNLGLDDFRHSLQSLHGKTIALCGISGVGKSTLLNALIPEAYRSTAEVSERTGQGKQTTTQALGILFDPSATEPGQVDVSRQSPASRMTIIDLPGIQSFGVEHLSKEEMASAFEDIRAHAQHCEFSNCSHLREKNCAVQVAVNSGDITISRFESYAHMYKEIEAVPSY